MRQAAELLLMNLSGARSAGVGKKPRRSFFDFSAALLICNQAWFEQNEALAIVWQRDDERTSLKS
jgi:hypothetical protein